MRKVEVACKKFTAEILKENVGRRNIAEKISSTVTRLSLELCELHISPLTDVDCRHTDGTSEAK